MSDAPDSDRGARAAQAEQNRLPPGQGVIGLRGLLGELDRRGCRAPVGIEVTSSELAARPAAGVVSLLAAALDGVLLAGDEPKRA